MSEKIPAYQMLMCRLGAIIDVAEVMMDDHPLIPKLKETFISLEQELEVFGNSEQVKYDNLQRRLFDERGIGKITCEAK